MIVRIIVYGLRLFKFALFIDLLNIFGFDWMCILSRRIQCNRRIISGGYLFKLSLYFIL